MRDIRYLCLLLRSILRSPPSRPRTGRAFRPLLALLALSAAAWTMQSGVEPQPEPRSRIEVLSQRTERAAEHLRYIEQIYGAEIAPLERVLLAQRAEPRLARRVAVALSAESRRTDIDSRLLLAVLLVENPWIDPSARSPVGAQGLMQVMPFHRGNWKPCAPRLDDIESNICHGARIFAYYLERENGNIERALLRYNGCVHGTNTPNCHSYPVQVLARTGRVTIHDWRRRMADAPRQARG
jgi:soluble lytic murein transglycosylase-like protein